MRGQEQCDDEDDAEDADTVSTHEEEATVSSSDALVSIEKIRLFLGRCEDVPDDVHKKVEDVESFVLQRLSSTRQKKITDFFKQYIVIRLCPAFLLVICVSTLAPAAKVRNFCCVTLPTWK